MSTVTNQPELGILARRRIEAGVIKPIYETMCRHIGPEKAQVIIGEAIAKQTVFLKGSDIADTILFAVQAPTHVTIAEL